MIEFDEDTKQMFLSGPEGIIVIPEKDELTYKLAMLYEGQCEGLGAEQAAKKYGYSKARYYQLLHLYEQVGAIALQSLKRGPKRLYRRTPEVEQQVVRYLFLDPEASAEVIAQRLRQSAYPISVRSVERVLAKFGLQKKLYAFRPHAVEEELLTERTKRQQRPERSDPLSLERMVRERLSDKISGSLVGIWLLVPEHLRLGTWDLLCSFTAQPPERVEPRLALQLVHEAALCVTGMRERRTLSQKGFELANGLPFIASDAAMHDLLEAHGVAEAQQLQVALGMIRRARGHFQGKRVAIDPHLMPSYSKRQMRRHRGHHHEEQKALKKARTFFALDVDTHQPICLLTGTASRTVTQATPPLLELVERILNPEQTQPLVLADSEHFTHRVIEQIGQKGTFRLLVPMPEQPYYRKKVAALPPEAFVRRWAGLATAKVPFDNEQGDRGRVYQLVQRLGERPEQYEYKSFLSTTEADEVVALMDDFPDRWHVEEFFHNHQALGWKRAGTLNLHIRYARMTMALIARAALHQLRQRLGEPYQSWEADHFATHLLRGLDGDIRVHDDTIVVTYYNADNVALLRRHYEDLSAKLQEQGINPAIPWLYDFKLDFRFK